MDKVDAVYFQCKISLVLASLNHRDLLKVNKHSFHLHVPSTGWFDLFSCSFLLSVSVELY